MTPLEIAVVCCLKGVLLGGLSEWRERRSARVLKREGGTDDTADSGMLIDLRSDPAKGIWSV